MNQPCWRPSSSFSNLKLRAELLQKIRLFFHQKNILEVETPLIGTASATDPYIDSFNWKNFYLQTSPEFAMKRLLAAGSGSIFQVCKAFRNEETGKFHNPEFTMLEWYRVGFNHYDLMNEMKEFFEYLFGNISFISYSYQELFEKHLEFNPHTIHISNLKTYAENNNLEISASFDGDDRDSWLQLLLNHLIEPHFTKTDLVFIYNFPATQAALAKLNVVNDITVAERFEVYLQGIELANGYHELTDANQQKQRFLADLEKRAALRYGAVNIDHFLLAALQHGLPDCAGVALGIDRLVMFAAQATHIKDVMSFCWEKA